MFRVTSSEDREHPIERVILVFYLRTAALVAGCTSAAR